MSSSYGLPAAAFAREGVFDTVHVKPIGPADRAEWTRLWRLYLAFYETELPDAQYERNWVRLADPAEPIFGYLAWVAGRPRGLVHIVLHRSFWMNEPSCYLQDLYADADLRGTGIGRALIQHVYDALAAAGGTRVHWLTHHTNAAGRRLYDRIAEESGFIQYRKAL